MPRIAVDDRPGDVGVNPEGSTQTSGIGIDLRAGGGVWGGPPKIHGNVAVNDDYIFWIWYEPEQAYGDFTYAQLREAGVLEPDLTINELPSQKALEKRLSDYMNQPRGGSGSGAGGAAGPTYVKPDERLVRDAVTNRLALMVGTVDSELVDKYTSLYMDETKRAFDLRESEQVDPMQSVTEAIRSQGDYQRIHELRPEGMDELEWVSSRQGALIRAGVTPKLAQELGVEQAAVGASDQQVTMAANIAARETSGQSLDMLRNRYRQSAYVAASLV